MRDFDGVLQMTSAWEHAPFSTGYRQHSELVIPPQVSVIAGVKHTSLNEDLLRRTGHRRQRLGGMSRVAPKLDLIWTPTSSDRCTPRELSHGLSDPVALPRRGREVGKHGHRGRESGDPHRSQIAAAAPCSAPSLADVHHGTSSFWFSVLPVLVDGGRGYQGDSIRSVLVRGWIEHSPDKHASLAIPPSAGRALVLRHDV